MTSGPGWIALVYSPSIEAHHAARLRPPSLEHGDETCHCCASALLAVPSRPPLDRALAEARPIGRELLLYHVDAKEGDRRPVPSSRRRSPRGRSRRRIGRIERLRSSIVDQIRHLGVETERPRPDRRDSHDLADLKPRPPPHEADAVGQLDDPKLNRARRVGRF